MEIVITEWALQSYLDLKATNVFTKEDYSSILRPDVSLLRDYPTHEKFKNDKFWGPATLRGGVKVEHGYKMKWHNLGPGRVQLRLCVAIIKSTAFLCQAYIKGSTIRDHAEAALLLNRVDDLEQGCYERRGSL